MSEARKTFTGVDRVARVYRQTFIPFDDSNDLLMDIMEAVSAAVGQIPKHYIEKFKSGDLDDEVDPRDIVKVISTFAREIKKLGKVSEFFARIFVATDRQLTPPLEDMQPLSDKVVRDAAFAGSLMEAWLVAWWVVWHNYSPFLTEAMRRAGFSLITSETPSTNAQTPQKVAPNASPLTAAPSS